MINTLAASRLFARDTICVDLGTATTFDCITADGVFLRWRDHAGRTVVGRDVDAPHIELPATEPGPPRQVIGKRTEECIRAGVLFERRTPLTASCGASKPNGHARDAARGRHGRTGGCPPAVLPGIRSRRAVPDTRRSAHGARTADGVMTDRAGLNRGAHFGGSAKRHGRSQFGSSRARSPYATRRFGVRLSL
ncbi:MAG: type III pantothenate kinase [Gemmatimonadaceae bacterium]|nr:type III pantothenate kinase [Gemmatimonadaceae bacterium]